ncbi:NAD-dependent epimerase/dehydratase family protein [Nocardioides yefusunii]|uniref:NAD-dependent epimerase/dehydratase family protein n=1 Tax=Nocardioides yefusunii TaxID=2500546 RepID=A0ABW1QUD5_9ACTN|nr:NAD(P)-dependent oxidoreductase [Nocardioides yefusunii]
MTGSPVSPVAVVGATGFVGRAVLAAFEQRGIEVRAIRAPRLETSARQVDALHAEMAAPALRAESERLREELRGCSVVVNAAGLSDATSGGDVLFGANALLPGLLAASTEPGTGFVHVSSAAVQGRRAVLDETTEVEPFSPYSEAKALGEAMVPDGSVVFRPTSVQGAGRRVTASLVRLCSSPLASVAAPGDFPTPQVLVENVADAIVFVALRAEDAPRVVLQPWEGVTTGELVRLLGQRRPLQVPQWLARALVRLGYALKPLTSRAAGIARRLEMLWFGQGQAPGWLDDKWAPPVGPEGWKKLSR